LKLLSHPFVLYKNACPLVLTHSYAVAAVVAAF
jgi:hypothetical protein